MFGDDGDKPLKASDESSVDDNGPRGRSVGIVVIFSTTVFELEPLRELEVELDGGTLERTLQCVPDGNIDFWTIEGAITCIQLPFAGETAVQHRFQLLGSS